MRRFSSFEQWDELLMSLSHSPPPPLLLSSPAEILLTPPARRRRSEPQWSAGARSSSRPTTLHLYPPFKKLYNCPRCQTDRPLHLVGRNPLRLRWFCPGFPLFSVPSKSEWTAKRSVGGVGVRYWWTSVQTSTSWRRALQRAPPTRPSGCIHRRVTFTVGLLLRGADLKGATVGAGFSFFRWMYSSHWTAAIRTISSQKDRIGRKISGSATDVRWPPGLFLHNKLSSFALELHDGSKRLKSDFLLVVFLFFFSSNGWSSDT